MIVRHSKASQTSLSRRSGHERLCDTMINLSHNSKNLPSSLFLNIKFPDWDEMLSCHLLSRVSWKTSRSEAVSNTSMGRRWAWTTSTYLAKRNLFGYDSELSTWWCRKFTLLASDPMACTSHQNLTQLYGMGEGLDVPVLVLLWFERGYVRDCLQRLNVDSTVD